MSIVVTSGFRHSRLRRPRAAVAAATLASLLLTGGAPLGPVAAGGPPTPAPAVQRDAAKGNPSQPTPVPTAPDPGSDAAGLQPSIQYEQAIAHAHDRIDFQPGRRVSVGFTPSNADRWSVGGVAPRALPSGRLDGKSIRSQKTGPGPASREPGSGVDRPTGGTPAAPADPASFEAAAPGAETPGTVSTEAAVTPAGLRREIFGFLPYWEVGSSTLRIDYSRISTIAYFGIGADSGGNLVKRNSDGSVTVGWSGWTSSRLTGIIENAHRSHTRVVLTVQSFGWTSTSLARQKALLGSATARGNLARQIAAAVRDRGADGVNLDFEPLASGGESGFVALVKSIRYALNQVHSGYQITFDTLGSIGNYPIEAATASGGADAIFIMGYDYRTAASNPVGSIAPLARDGYDIRDTVAAYAARVPASRLILGVPYYGRAWSTASDALHSANISSTKTGASTTVVYDTAAGYLAAHGRAYDQTEQVAWTAYRRQNCTATYGCVTSWRQLYVDDATALGKKYDLVNAYGLRGAGIWALGYDGTRPELWNMIQAKFITDTKPPRVGIVRLPATEPNPGFRVSWTGTDDSGISSYGVQASVDGGPWTDWISGTTATSATWAGFDGHGYAFRVRARDVKGNVGTWNVASTSASDATLGAGGFGRVLIDGLSVHSSPGVSTSTIGALPSGAIVGITASPRSVDGYTWVQIIGPATEWPTVEPSFSGAWVASSGGRLAAVSPPNATVVDAVIGGLAFDHAGSASIGSSSGAVAHRAFSPNGDGTSDGLAITWTNAVDLDRLALRVFRADGSVVGDVAASTLGHGSTGMIWNGTVAGHRLPDGRYLLSLIGTSGASTYYNPVTAFRPSALAAYGVTIDTTPPTVSSSAASDNLLSPNGDGLHDTVRVSLSAPGASTWAFGVAPLTASGPGTAIVVRTGAGGSPSVIWDGTAGGTAVADGTYLLQLVAADAAGNRVSRSWAVRVDRTAPRLTPSAPATFSPNHDGIADSARLGWTSTEIISGIARLSHGSTTVRSWTVSRGTSGAVTWDGRNASGGAVPDGVYTFSVAGRDAAGNRSSASVSITVDRTLAHPRWSQTLFFPEDGDALATMSRLAFDQTRTASVSAAIYSGTTRVRTIWLHRTLAAGSHSWRWDGRNDAGAIVPRGVYTLHLTATTALGTTTAASSVRLDAFRVSASASAVRAGQTLILTMTTAEPLVRAPSITFNQPGRAAVHRTATSLGGGRYRVAFLVGSGPSGTASFLIAGRDTGGGLNTTGGSVAVH